MSERRDLDADLARELEELRALPAGDPRRREALDSPRMRALLRDLEDFERGDEGTSIPAKDLEDARERLAPRPARRPRIARRSPPARWWVAAAAVVVAAVGIRVAIDSPNLQTPTMRSPASDGALEVDAQLAAPDRLELRWVAEPRTVAVQVLLFDVDLREVGSLELLPGGRASVDLSPFAEHGNLAFRLVLRDADEEIARSTLIPIPENPQRR